MTKCVGSGWSLRGAGVVAVSLAALAGLSFAGLGLLVLGIGGGDDSNLEQPAISSVATGVLADEWTERIQKDSTWRSNRNTWTPPKNGRGKPSQLQGPPEQPAWFITPAPGNPWLEPPRYNDRDTIAPSGAGRSRGASGYRTVCVRSCDGYFFPISYGTSESSFSRDQTTCTNSCSGAKLYYYKAGSEEPEDMVDLSGQPYSRSKNANLFRTQYVESCKCKPHPWEQEATERHRIYALEDQRRKGNRAVVAELNDLKAKNRLDNRSSSRRRPADRRRDRRDESSIRTAVPQVAAMQAPAPRSDVSRGQGGDRLTIAENLASAQQAGAAPAATARSTSVVTGAVAAAASAATVQSVTSRATATAPADAGTHRDALHSAAIEAMPLAPAITVSLPQPGEEPMAAPEPVEVQPPPPVAKSSRSSRARRESNARAAARQAEVRRAEARSRARQGDWARRVFNP